MTTKADIHFIVPTANAKAQTQKAATSLDSLLALAELKASEIQIAVKQIIALHPIGGGDASNLTALNSILSQIL